MAFTEMIIGEKYLEALGWTLVHAAWQVALISLLLWLTVQVIPKKSSQGRYIAAFAALLFIFAASCWTLTYQLDHSEKAVPAISLVQNAPEEINFIFSGDGISENQSFGSLFVLRLANYLPLIVNLWILGAVFYFIRLTGSFFDLEKLHKKHRQPVPEALLQKADSLAASMGVFRKVQVIRSSLVHVPVTYGLIKPVVLLPASLILSMSTDQLEAIIAHELAHIKRYDYLANLFQSVMEVLFFFHPCFWWINRMIREEREIATDDLALSIGIKPDALAYGLAEVANQSSSPTPGMALAASENKNFTLFRIKRIMGNPISSPKLSPLITITMIFTFILSTLLLMGAQEQENKHDDSLLAQSKSQSSKWEKAFHKLFPGAAVKPSQDTLSSSKKEESDTETSIYDQNGSTPLYVIDGVVRENMDFVYPRDIESIQVVKDAASTSLYGSRASNGVFIVETKSGEVGARRDTVPSMEQPKAPKMESLPKLELTPAPQMDGGIRDFPALPPTPPAPHAKFGFPTIDVRVQSDSLGRMARELQEIENDNSPEAKQRKQTLQSAMAQVEQNIEVLAKAFEGKMEDWKEAHGESFEKFENEMKLWEEKMKAHAKAWESSFAPKMKAFEEKMLQWQKENEPKLKDFEEKLKIWEKENAPKLNQFEKEMDIWLKENKEKIQPRESGQSNKFLNFFGHLNADNKASC